jgi:hypothetical protein
LGAKRMRAELTSAYTEALFRLFGSRVPNISDLCCYFFEKAREEIATGRAERAGLLATNSIRDGGSRRVLDRIKHTGDIFMAWSDEPWTLDGAAVRISIVGFDDGSDKNRTLNGRSVANINADLTSVSDSTKAKALAANLGISFCWRSIREGVRLSRIPDDRPRTTGVSDSSC